jgi:hypothetical protein
MLFDIKDHKKFRTPTFSKGDFFVLFKIQSFYTSIPMNRILKKKNLCKNPTL